MKSGPNPVKEPVGRYAAPRRREPRITLQLEMPPNARIGSDSFGRKYHEFRLADAWVICGGRGVCSECIREDGMKTTIERLREALEEHFGLSRMATVGVDEDLFAEQPPESEGRALGDSDDRIEMLCCVEAEFGVDLPDAAAQGRVTLAELAGLVDQIVTSKNASGH